MRVVYLADSNDREPAEEAASALLPHFRAQAEQGKFDAIAFTARHDLFRVGTFYRAEAYTVVYQRRSSDGQWAPAEASDPPLDAKGLADGIVQLLSEHDLEAVAELVHYPPSYTNAEREKDVAAVVKSLEFYVGRFGSVSDVAPELGPAEFFEVGAGGGDPPYWESISPFSTTDYLYSVNFSKFGPGFLKIRTVHHPTIEGPGVQSIGFALSAAREDSKAKIISVTKDFFEFKGRQLPANIDEIFEQGIRPVERPETRNSTPAAGS